MLFLDSFVHALMRVVQNFIIVLRVTVVVVKKVDGLPFTFTFTFTRCQCSCVRLYWLIWCVWSRRVGHVTERSTMISPFSRRNFDGLFSFQDYFLFLNYFERPFEVTILLLYVQDTDFDLGLFTELLRPLWAGSDHYFSQKRIFHFQVVAANRVLQCFFIGLSAWYSHCLLSPSDVDFKLNNVRLC